MVNRISNVKSLAQLDFLISFKFEIRNINRKNFLESVTINISNFTQRFDRLKQTQNTPDCSYLFQILTGHQTLINSGASLSFHTPDIGLQYIRVFSQSFHTPENFNDFRCFLCHFTHRTLDFNRFRCFLSHFTHRKL